jgi:hypothetical protein
MNRLVSAFLAVFLCGGASAQIQQRQQLSGRYFTPASLAAQMNSTGSEKSAQSYLVGAYDLTQDSGQSCATRGTTTPVQLEKIFSDYLQAHPGLKNADRTAAGVAAQAFAEYWPCQPNASATPQSQSSPEPNGASPLTLTVTSAQRTNQGGYTTTHIIGSLSDDPQQQQLHMVCDGGIFSRGPRLRRGRAA